jgi:DNA helicase TIP49 (TBP-interacting protein)
VEFKALKLKDVKLVCDTVSDVQMDADVIKTIWSISKGTLRKIVKLIYAIESIAKSRKMTSISITDVKGVLGDTANSTNLS